MTMTRPPLLQLTWAGLEAAIDLIAACCDRRDRCGVYGASPAGQVLAVALAERLGLNVLPLPTPGMLLVDGAVTTELQRHASRYDDADTWVWVDDSPDHTWNSVMKLQGSATLAYPWQELPATCRRAFVSGFDD
jgi:hypothetical protein